MAKKQTSYNNGKSSGKNSPSNKKSLIDKLIILLKKINKKKRKNISKKYPVGRTLKTKDKYLPVNKKGESNDPKDKRFIAIIDSNKKDELAVVRFTSQRQKNTTELATYKKGNHKKTHFKHFVEIVDNEKKPIKVDNKKFIANSNKLDLSAKEVSTIRKKVLHNCKQSSRNKKLIAKLKDNGYKK